MSKSWGRALGQIIDKLVSMSHFEAEYARIINRQKYYSVVLFSLFQKIRFGMKCAFCSGMGSFSSSPRGDGKD